MELPESRSGSLEVVSLVMEDALMLKIELPSPKESPRGCMETPDIDDAAEARPFLGISVSVADPEDGRRSGKSAVTRVMISRGAMTR